MTSHYDFTSSDDYKHSLLHQQIPFDDPYSNYDVNETSIEHVLEMIEIGGKKQGNWGSFIYISLLCAFAGIVLFNTSFHMVSTVFIQVGMKKEFRLDSIREGMIGSLIFFGWIIGALGLSSLSDQFGRRNQVYSMAFLCFVFGFVYSFSHSFAVFGILRFFLGVALGALNTTAYTYVIEISPANNRNTVTSFQAFMWAIASSFLSFISYLLPSWHLFSLSISFTPLLILPFYFILPESPRVLLVNRKEKEAIASLHRIAYLSRFELPFFKLQKLYKDTQNITHNKLNTSLDYNDHIKNSVECQNNSTTSNPIFSSFIFLFSKYIINTTLILSYTWYAASFCYFGLVFETGNFSGNIYINNILLSSVEVPGVIIAWYFSDKIGRRTVLSGAFGVAGLCFLLAGLFTWIDSEYSTHVLIKLFALLGKICMASIFNTIYTYTAESFSTNIRGTAMGLCNFFRCLGGLISPILVTSFSLSVVLPLFGLVSISAIIFLSFQKESLGELMVEVE